MKVRYKGSFIPRGIYNVDREMKGFDKTDGYLLITPNIDGFEKNKYWVDKKDCEMVEQNIFKVGDLVTLNPFRYNEYNGKVGVIQAIYNGGVDYDINFDNMIVESRVKKIWLELVEEKPLELKDLINEKKLVNIYCETLGGIDHYVYDVKLTHKQALDLSLGQVINGKMLKDFECVHNGNEAHCELTFVNTPKGYGETHFNPSEDVDRTEPLDKHEFCLPYMKGCESPKLEPFGRAPKIRNIKYWNKAVTQNPIDTNDIRLDPNGRARHAKICDEVSFVKKETLDEMIKLSYAQFIDRLPTYQRKEDKKEMEQKRIIPTYIGYKGREITLVWEDGSKTKAIAKEDEELDFTYGFLIAYYKHIHSDLDSQAMQKRLEGLIYNMDMDYQRGYLFSVFSENCGLSIRKQEQFFDLYMYSLAPFEVEEENFSKTFVVDNKFLKKPKYNVKYIEIPF